MARWRLQLQPSWVVLVVGVWVWDAGTVVRRRVERSLGGGQSADESFAAVGTGPMHLACQLLQC